MREELRYFTLPGVPEFNISFGNFSHETGERRALVQCSLDGHTKRKPRCRRGVFLMDHGNCPNQAALFLATWVYIGHYRPLAAGSDHRKASPTLAELDVARGFM